MSNQKHSYSKSEIDIENREINVSITLNYLIISNQLILHLIQF